MPDPQGRKQAAHVSLSLDSLVKEREAYTLSGATPHRRRADSPVARPIQPTLSDQSSAGPATVAAVFRPAAAVRGV
jgi:hypothetical protein